MNNRLNLHELLVSLLDSRNVYFQPPNTVKMKYPCIIYRRNAIDTTYAGNLPYTQIKSYQIVVVDKDPDSKIPDKIGKLPMCIFDRHYTADNLNHDIYNIFY